MRRRREEMPPTGAGLIRYFREEGYGVKISPKSIVAFTIAIILLEIIIHVYDPFRPSTFAVLPF